ncbi:multiple epidermal growth factor-like domains protein 9 isoform X2 [Oncorhynchus kisutch]|uniref:multiple epidermal growth factor-like domains protein 9 isoform X2 n=1 Tax=Oncorhynchus kisutch TaxID=8019 RepID=UPI0009A01B4B|nr:multiple epidermal growth factor-like domains protein 9 isoform X2 [Oncorhynchus kisutch]
MRLTTLMMYISLALLFILYIGFSDAAPRVNSYDASPISRKPRSASESLEPLYTTLPNRLPEGRFVLGQLNGLTPSPTIGFTGVASKTIRVSTTPVSPTATTIQPPTTDPTTPRPSTEMIFNTRKKNTFLSSRTSNSSKISADGQASVFPPEKTNMVSMVSQRTSNDAWSSDNIDASISSSENGQESLCNCSSEGALDVDDCDKKTGQCFCMSGYTGLLCEDCEEGHFTNGTTGCIPCGCDSYGAVNHLCDSSGMCVCKTGVYGPKCDECHPGFFRFSSTGCQPCQCNNLTNYCHPQSGVCLNCQGNTQGPNCEECKPRFYRSSGAASTDACVTCPCSNTTSTGTCHTDSDGFPVCDQCLSEYSGQQCDRCKAGFYSSNGVCVTCDCSGNADPTGPAQLCHPDTGHCLSCTVNTTGPQCQLCASGFTGDALAHNCTRPARIVLTPEPATTTETPKTTTTTSAPTPSSKGLTATVPTSAPTSTNNSSILLSIATTQVLLTSLGSPTVNTTAALTEVSWTQFNIIVLAVIILVVVLLLGFVGGVYTYREYQNRKLNAPFWTIELKEDNISFSSYHDSIPNADVSGLLEDEANEVAPNGQLALTNQGNCYKA